MLPVYEEHIVYEYAYIFVSCIQIFPALSPVLFPFPTFFFLAPVALFLGTPPSTLYVTWLFWFILPGYRSGLSLPLGWGHGHVSWLFQCWWSTYVTFSGGDVIVKPVGPSYLGSLGSGGVGTTVGPGRRWHWLSHLSRSSSFLSFGQLSSLTMGRLVGGGAFTIIYWNPTTLFSSL